MIKRVALRKKIETALKRSRCVALLGPRQSGKTTIARIVAAKFNSVFLDLENPEDAARLTNPKMALERLEGLVVLDEIQLRPDLFPVLRVLLDRNPLPAKFLILGSASPDLIAGTSETLAGRVEFVDMSGFSLDELSKNSIEKRWLRGGFPLSFLADSDADSMAWRLNFIRTFLERDMRRLGVDSPPETLRRFLLMLSHCHAQTWNASKLSASLNLSAPTLKKYLDILTGAYLIRQLPPWCENMGKRLVKSPKIYFRDSGLLHCLINTETIADLEAHPYYGASWEGFALEEVVEKLGSRDVYFWRTQAGAELDLLLLKGSRRFGFEFKCSETPSTTKSMRLALSDLKLEHLHIVYPGKTTFPLDENITAVSIADIPDYASL